MWYLLLMGVFCALGFLISFFTLKKPLRSIFSIEWVLFSVFAYVFLIVGPKTAIKPIEFDDGHYINILSRAIVYFLTVFNFVLTLGALFVFGKTVGRGKEIPLPAGIIIAGLLIVGALIWTVNSFCQIVYV